MEVDRLAAHLSQVFSSITEQEFASALSQFLANTKPTLDTKAVVRSRAEGTCTVLIVSGQRKGEPCGQKENVAGSSRCKRHADDKKSAEKNVKSQATLAPSEKSNPTTKTSEKPTDGESENKENQKPKDKPASKAAPKRKPIDAFEKTDVASLIQERKSSVCIYQNEFGNWEHKGSSLVWDKETQSVYGRQALNGTILPLSDNDKNLCRLNGWKIRVEEVITTSRDFEVASDEESDDSLSDEAED